MLEKETKKKNEEAEVKGQRLLVHIFCFFSVLCGSFCRAGEGLDKSRYIGLDEIRPGMKGYCLTGFEGTKIERFDLEVLSVVRKLGPSLRPRPSSRDAILVLSTDERFIRTGPVGGCSGSPVYIDNRLAGALAFAWSFSKDPLYGVTPIEEMLKVGQARAEGAGAWHPGFAFDYSAPIDFAAIYEQITNPRDLRDYKLTGYQGLPCPLITSGLPAEVCKQFEASVASFGLMAVPGVGVSPGPDRPKDLRLTPGACLCVPLVSGDITAEAIGTVTEVVDDKVYAFGHGFLGHGPVDLPMATGEVHTVVSSVYRSFKFASAVEIVGALRTDESAAVCGLIGAKAQMIPLRIEVERYNDAEKKVYNCHLASNRLLTPLMLRLSVAGAAVMLGWLPPDHMIEYKVAIGVEGTKPIEFQNVSTSLRLDEMLAECVGATAILMSNPYKRVNIESIEVKVRIAPKSPVSRLWSVDLSDSRLKAGEEVKIGVVLESYLAEKKRYQCSLKIPEDLAPGQYDLLVCGVYDYQRFLRKATPHKFVPQNLSSLIEVINDILAVKRDKLYCLLALPAGGVTLEKAELPDLPATKALILQNAKRTLKTQPYHHWEERSFDTGTVIIDKQVLQITVEK